MQCLSSIALLRCVTLTLMSLQAWFYCVQVLNADAQRRLKTLVFCNSMDSCRAVDYHCRCQGCHLAVFNITAQRQHSSTCKAATCPVNTFTSKTSVFLLL